MQIHQQLTEQAKLQRVNLTMELGEELRRRLGEGLGVAIEMPYAQFGGALAQPSRRTLLHRLAQQTRHAVGRGILLAGVSALALLVHDLPAEAFCVGCAPGKGTINPVTTAVTSVMTSAQQAALATQQSVNSLNRALQALQAMQAAQAAAHNLAQQAASSVTNGLGSGGLVVDPRVIAGTDSNLWVNANQPTETTSGGQTTVTVVQTAPRALLTWQEFDVGRNTTVYFNQSAGNLSSGNNWIVVNRIDAANSPSQIFGQIKAEGTVMLINPNGIIFNGSSQINVHTLIAAAEDVNGIQRSNDESVFLRNSNAAANYAQINVNGIPLTTSTGTPIQAPVNEDAFDSFYVSNGLYIGNKLIVSNPNVPNQQNVGVTVDQGALISTNVNGFDNGGYVALLGPQVSNAGSIETSAGEIILGAGSSIQIVQPGSTAATSSYAATNVIDTSSGQLYYTPPPIVPIPSVLPNGAVATNTGLLISTRGNVTLVGDGVDQEGVVEATTSITRPGSITIAATGQVLPNNTDSGLAVFGANSVTTILPEEDGETLQINSSSSFVPPSIAITTTSMDMTPGSLIEAPSANMTVSGLGSGVGRVLLEPGSTIDLSGLTDVTVPVSELLFTFKVTANDVADTPLAQSLIGQTVTINLALTGTRSDGETWVGSPLFASSGAGYFGDIPQSIDQLLTKGGSLNIGGGPLADIVTAPGSLINVSGGWINYTGGTITTTSVSGIGGTYYSIGNANPFITYSNNLSSGSYQEPGYVDGVSAGRISVSAINPVLEGSIDGGVVVGTHQTQLSQLATGANGAQATPDQMPTAAALSINITGQPGFTGATDDVVLASSAQDILGPNFSLSSTLSLPATGASDGSPGTITYSTTALSQANLGSIGISGANALSMNAGASLSVQPGGHIGLTGVTEIDGTLTAHAGSISLIGNVPQAGFNPQPPTGSNTVTFPPRAVVLGPQGVLDVSGLWVNDTASTTLLGDAYVNGGSVSIATIAESSYLGNEFGNQEYFLQYSNDITQSIVLAPGSVINVTSGGYVGANGQIARGSDGLPKGNGGNLSLLTYQGGFGEHGTFNSAMGGYTGGVNPVEDTVYTAPAPTLPRTVINSNGTSKVVGSEPNTASVYFGGSILSGGFNTGGTFTLQAPIIQIGGTASLTSFFANNSATNLAALTGLPASAFSPSSSNAGLIALPTSFFANNGFSNFALTSTYGSVTVTAGTTLTLEQRNFLVPTTGFPATGAEVANFASGFLPAFARQPVSLSLTEVAFADGSEIDAPATTGAPPTVNPSATDPTSANAGILIASGASIVADPKAAIALNATGDVTVLGDITAPSGSITLTNTGIPLGSNGANTLAPLDVWLGAGAELNVAGAFVTTPTTTGTSTGVALPGGTISLSSNTVVVAQQGSILDFGGTQGNSMIGHEVVPEWSNGGTLTLGGTGAIYFAGAIEAAGGTLNGVQAGAGGSLDVNSNVTIIAQSGNAAAAFAGPAPTTQAPLLALTTSLSTLNTTSTTSNSISPNGIVNFTIQTGLPSLVLTNSIVTISDGSGDTMTGNILSYNPSTGALAIGVTGSTGSGNHSAWTIGVTSRSTFITADTINSANSGLDSVSLNGLVGLSGNVTLRVPDALYINGNITLLPAGITPSSPLAAYAATSTSGGINTIGATDLSLQAGYIAWSNTVVAATGLSNGPAVPTLADGTLNLNATAQIDIIGVPAAMNAENLNLNVSGGDVRLIALSGTNYAVQGGPTVAGAAGGNPLVGALVVADNLSITAREVYPETDSAFLLISLGLAPNKNTSTNTCVSDCISFASNGMTPVAPLSANGAILVDAASIMQSGALVAPLGTIQLGFSASETLPAIFVPGAVTNDPYNPFVDRGVSTGLFDRFGTNKPAVLSTVTTQYVTLTSGSQTSVSAAGLSIPYGTTTDGTNWSEGGVALNGPPAKLIALGGANINTASGAVLDASGGGDVYATEFVQGTGGSRNVLTTTTQTVYALVPAYDSAVAPFDPTFGTSVGPGTAVTLSGGNGIPAGTYTLLPAMYATMPGAYRVVVVSTNTTAGPSSNVQPDGSVFMTGTLTNAITGVKSSQTALLEIQSNAVWTKYSEIDIASGNSFFAKAAAANGAVPPQLPIDAGQLSVAAAASLILNATNIFAPAAGGRSGEADITGTNLIIASSDLASKFAGTGSVVLDADQLSDLGIGSVLIGGTRAQTPAGTLITATAENLEVDTDAAHPLTGPELLLVSLAPTSAGAARGLIVDPDSVIAAKGSVAAGTDNALIIGVNPVANSNGQFSAGVSGDGSLLRLSNGTAVTVTRNYVPGIYTGPGPLPKSLVALGNLAIGANASLSGNALTLDSSGNTTLGSGVNLQAANYDLSGNVLNLGGGSGGLVLTSSQIAVLAGAQSIKLRSYGAINFFGNNSFGSTTSPVGTFTLDGSGFYSDGGTTSITAANIVVIDSQATPNNNGANTTGSGGSLSLDATTGTVSFGIGGKTWFGFATANVTAGTQILFTGTGSIAAGGTSVTLQAPAVVADLGSVQSLTTTGTLTIQQGAGTAPTFAATDTGGSLTFSAGSITDSGTIVAQGGNVTLHATGTDVPQTCPACGDVTLNAGATINAKGTEISLNGQIEDTPGGTISLISDNGNVALNGNTLIDVSAAGNGYAGSVVVQAANGQATLNGTLQGGAAYKDLGGNFFLIANTLSGNLPLSGFTGSFAVELGNGDIDINAGQTLTSGNVLLVANNGSINVNGTIDASGPTGGTIALYGAGSASTVTDVNNVTYTNITGGVTIGASAVLNASYQADPAADPANANGTSALVQTGGTITLGTTGVPNGTLNSTYGYENVNAPLTVMTSSGPVTINGSGAINVASGASFNVSGGPGGTDINNSGGTVYVRAPIMTNNNINVSFAGTLVTNAVNGSPSGNGIVAEAYAVWSTTDKQSDLTKYFDGTIDPAGFFSSNGQMVAGNWSNVQLMTLSSGGSGYTSAPTITLTGAGWSNVNALALMSASTGAITSLASGGSGFVNGTYGCTGTTCTSGSNTINLTFNTDGNGSGLAISTVTVSGGAVTGFTVAAGGSGYDGSISVGFAGAGGAQATSKLLSLTVSGIAVAPPAGSVLTGQMPSSATFSGGGGSGAALNLSLTAGGVATQTILVNGNSMQEAAGLVLPGSGLFAPATANANHSTFYQTTLLGFVNRPFLVASSTATGENSSPFSVGTQTLTTAPGLAIAVGQDVTATDSANSQNTLFGTVTSYNATTGALVIAATQASGPGTAQGSAPSGNWNVVVENTPAVVGNFANAQLQINGSSTTSTLPSTMLQLQPEVDLVNPSTTINGGNVTVVSNWNLGAGIYNTATGAYSLFYRTTDGGNPGVLSLRAINNINVNATISDGFYETADPFFVPPLVPPSIASNASLTAAQNGFAANSQFASASFMPGDQSISAPPTTFPSGWITAYQNNWYGDYYVPYITMGVRELDLAAGAASGRYILTGSSGIDAFDTNASDYVSQAVFNSAQTTFGKTNSFDPNPNDYVSYTAYVTAYNANYVGKNVLEANTSFTVGLSGASNSNLGTQTISGFNNNPAQYGSYADYVLAYKAYVTAVRSALTTYYGTHKSGPFPSTILAPLPPPTIGTPYTTANGATSVETTALYETDYTARYFGSTTNAAYLLYALSYGTTTIKIEPGDTSGANSATASTTSSLWLIAQPYLPSPSSIPIAAAPGLGNTIANNPGVNVTTNSQGTPVNVADFNTTSAAQTLIAGQSFSYNFTAGAYFPANGAGSVDPGAIVPLTTTVSATSPVGSVTLNGHADYTDVVQTGIPSQLVEVPTLVRTGTGSITAAAAGNFELLDQTAPGAVYTAGAATANAPGFASVPPVASNGNGLISTPTWAVNGGSVTISAGQNIIGIETPVDADGTETGGAGVFTGQMWSGWYYAYGVSTGSLVAPFNPSVGGVQYSTWVNYASFFQGVGALGGGNVTLKATNNIYDISASLPETIQVSGGQAVGSPPVASYFGGGDLLVEAGNNLYSSAFYVGRGSGRVTAGGAITVDPANPITGQPTQVARLNFNSSSPTINPGQGAPVFFSVPLVLAVQDSFISVTGAGAVTTGGIYDPADLPANVWKDIRGLTLLGLPSGTVSSGSATEQIFGGKFTSQGPESGVSITSIAGNVDLNATDGGLCNNCTALPSLFAIGSLSETFTVGGGPIGGGRGDFAYAYPPTLDVTALAGNIQVANSFEMLPSPNGNLVMVANGSISTALPSGNFTESVTMLDQTAAPAGLLGLPNPTVLTVPTHINDPIPVIIAAGDDITGDFTFIKPADLFAGRDIVNTVIVGQNNSPTDITSIIAGRDILAVQTRDSNNDIENNTSTFTISGPGQILIEAGRNLGPFTTSAAGGGIFAVGGPNNTGSSTITALFGVGPGVDYAAAINAYVNPINALTNSNDIDYLTDIASILGETPDQAWVTFQQLSPQRQQLLVDRAFLDFLTQVNLDFNNPVSPFFQKFGRAYDTIATLFPASFGYTNNNTGDRNGASVTVHTGNLIMPHSLIETEAGGDINILGPGGNLVVGSNSADSLKPSQQGILTLEGGTIRTYTDGSALIFQSRIFTEEGGDIDMFSANGDLNAGKGPKSSAAFPPLGLICDVDGYCGVNPAGLITGAGIGALLTVPGQDPTKSNVVLSAPHGKVDAGAAGVRATVVHLVGICADCFNITANTIVGLPTFNGPSAGQLTTASNTVGGTETKIAPPANNNSQASIIIVQVIGYGGGQGDDNADDVSGGHAGGAGVDGNSANGSNSTTHSGTSGNSGNSNGDNGSNGNDLDKQQQQQ